MARKKVQKPETPPAGLIDGVTTRCPPGPDIVDRVPNIIREVADALEVRGELRMAERLRVLAGR